MLPLSKAWFTAGPVSATAWPGSAPGGEWQGRGPGYFQATSATPDRLSASSAASVLFQLGQCTFPTPVLAEHPACLCLFGLFFFFLLLCGNYSDDTYPAKLGMVPFPS